MGFSRLSDNGICTFFIGKIGIFTVFWSISGPFFLKSSLFTPFPFPHIFSIVNSHGICRVYIPQYSNDPIPSSESLFTYSNIRNSSSFVYKFLSFLSICLLII